MSCKPVNGRVETFDKAILAVADTAVEVAKGIGDTAYSLYAFPDHAVGYVSGRDEQFGQRRSWSSIGSSLTFSDNPVYRAADVLRGMVYGGMDLLTGHALNYIFNERLGLRIKYFSPSPTTTRELARDFSMAGAILAVPAIKARMAEKTHADNPAREGIRELAYRVAADETGSLDVGPVVISHLIRKAKKGDYPSIEMLRDLALARVELAPQIIPGMIEAAEAGEGAAWALKDLALARAELAPRIIPGMIEAAKVDGETAVALSDLVEARAELFTEAHIPDMIEAARINGDAIWALGYLVEARAEFAPRIIPYMTEAAKVNEGAARALRDLAEARMELAPQIIPGIIEAAKTNRQAARALKDLVVSRTELASRIIPGMIEAAKVNGKAARELGALAKARTELAPQIIPGMIEAAKVNKEAASALSDLVETMPWLFSDTPAN